MVIFKEVAFGYKPEHKILNDVSFEIPDGAFVSLEGPSGAGKSTILWSIMGELKPQKGVIQCCNANPMKLRKRGLMLYRRKIGYVPQDLLLLERHNVFDNVYTILRGVGISRKEAISKTNNVLEIVGLYPRRKDMPCELSGGERQRLAIARALGMMPKVLLADEPTGNLDTACSKDILSLFKQICEMGITVIIATHEIQLMESLGADRLELKDGVATYYPHKGQEEVGKQEGGEC